MWTALLFVLALLVVPQDTTPANAAPATRPASADSEDPAFDALLGRYRGALAEYNLEVKRLRRRGVGPAQYPPPPARRWYAEFRELAEAGSGRAWGWVLENLEAIAEPGEARSEIAREALTHIAEEHRSEGFVARFIEDLPKIARGLSDEERIEFFEALIPDNDNAEVVSEAMYSIGWIVSDRMSTKDPARLDRAISIWTDLVNGYTGTRGAKAAAGHLYNHEHRKIHEEIHAWLDRVDERASAGTPPAEWPPFPLHAHEGTMATLAAAGSPYAEYWVQVFYPAFSQAERQGIEQALRWFAEDLSRRYGATVVPEMDLKFRLLEFLFRHFPNEPWIFDAVRVMQEEVTFFGPERYRPVLELLADGTSEEPIRYQALFTLALALERGSTQAEFERALELLEKIEAEAPIRRLQREAASERREFALLMPGAVAPPIEGIDQDQLPIQFQGYRGKVVLLVFWGFWDPASVALIPELNRLDEQYRERPFRILGVNTDLTDLRKFRNKLDEHGIRWRNAMQQRRSGPMCQRYQVARFPLLVLVDAEGVIRSRGLDLAANERLIEELLSASGASGAAAGESEGGQ